MSEKQEIKKGSVGISPRSHEILTSLVFEDSLDEYTNDKPFTSIVEAFRFAFSLGYVNSRKATKTGKHVTVAPRQFVVDEYLHLIKTEVLENNTSLGGLISEYAEGGCNIIQEHLTKEGDILSLLE